MEPVRWVKQATVSDRICFSQKDFSYLRNESEYIYVNMIPYLVYQN